MNRFALIPVMVSLASVYASAQAPASHVHPTSPAGSSSASVTAKATLQNPQGRALGEATLRETSAGVLIKVDLQNVTPGAHAFHVHGVGRCEAPDFTTAGGHFNPAGKQHGLFSADGPHAGDLPNLFVPGEGRLSAEVLVPNVTLSPGVRSLFDADGSALMLHATADDYASDPAGNAGGRIGCGVVAR